MTKEGMGDEAMKKSLFYRAKKMPPSAQIMLLFAVEGVFLQYITSINGFGLNLYATNMGATDSQIGIIQMVPNIVACAALLPLGQLAAVGMIAKVVRKKSPDFALIFAGIGLCFCPVIMILVPHLPLAYRGVTFIVLMTVLNAPQCAVALCTVQILLNAAPEKNRSL